jgi:hypothetical protein
VSSREADIQQKIKEWLEDKGCIVIKNTTIGSYGVAGFPDLTVYMHMRKVWLIEVKRPGESPDSRQSYWIERLERYDYHVNVVHSLKEAKDLYEMIYKPTTRPPPLDSRSNVRKKGKGKITIRKKASKKKARKR